MGDCMNTHKKLLIGSAIWFVILLALGLGHNAAMEDGVTYEHVSIPVGDHIVTAQYVTNGDNDQLKPGILVFHGVIASKEWMIHLTRALALSDFAVLAVDQRGHGGNTGQRGDFDVDNETITVNGEDAVGAIEYLSARDDVDSTRLASTGWSMGASTTIELNRAFALGFTSIRLSASVMIGNLLNCESSDSFDATFPNNLLDLVGVNDELFDPEDAKVRFEDCVVDEPVENDVFYGSFADGTARQVVLTQSDHVFEAVEPEIISRTVKWMQSALGKEDEASPDPVQSLNLEFFSAIVGVLWYFGYWIIYFEFTKVESTDLVTDAEGGEKDDDSEEGGVYKWWWWITHQLLIVLSIGIGYILDLFISDPVCVFFGATLIGMAFGLIIVFGIQLMTKKGKGYALTVVKKAFAEKCGSFSCGDSDLSLIQKWKKFSASPIGAGLAFIKFVLLSELLLSLVPYPYGLAVPLLKGFDNYGPRIVLFLVLWLLLIPGFFFEAETIALRTKPDFKPKTVVQVVLARTWFLFFAMFFIIIVVFGAQARILGPLAFFTLVIYPMGFNLAIESILTQFARSRGHSTLNVAIFIAGALSYLFAQLLLFENC